MTIIKIIDCNFDEVEEVCIENNLYETLSMLNQIQDIICCTERFRFEKTGYLAVDFMNNIIEVQVKFE